MLVLWVTRLIGSDRNCSGIACILPMPMFAVIAWEARQHQKVQGKNLDKPLHEGKGMFFEDFYFDQKIAIFNITYKARILKQISQHIKQNPCTDVLQYRDSFLMKLRHKPELKWRRLIAINLSPV